MIEANKPRFDFERMVMSLRYGFFVKQKFEMLEAMTGYEQANKYYVFELD